ncbi:MAG: response regulator transcription factor [Ferruginibacter sp.]
MEDEPLAGEVLEDYINQVSFLKLMAKCKDAIFALETLKKNQIDVIFLDIHLPKIKGIDFIKTISNSPQIIITSAYQEYALQSYELDVVDYLLKPIEFSRFLMAVNKLKHLNDIDRGNSAPSIASERAYLFFNVSKKKVKMFLDEILYIESLKEYIKVISKDKRILTKFQLGDIEDILNKNNFIRIHRSFIVAKNKIDAFTATDVEINGQQIPIGRSYKELVVASLQGGT